jgi:hypothetical protein
MDLTKNEEYILTLTKKLNSFKQRAPIYIYFNIMPSSIIIEEANTKKIFRFEIDFNIEIEEQVKRVKEFLKKNLYPRLLELIEEPCEPDIEELNKYMIDNSCSFDKAFKVLSKKTIKKEYVIDKINIKRNQLILENKIGEQFLYQMRMPITLYLKNFIRDQKDFVLAFNKLKEQSEFLYKIERKINEEKRMGN